MLPCHTPPFQIYIVVQILTNFYKQFFFYLKLTQYKFMKYTPLARFGITIRGGIKHNHITSHILDLNLLMDREVHSFS